MTVDREGPGSGPHPALPAVEAAVLVVDDRPDKLTAITALLEAPGTRVVTARSGEEALRHVLKEEFAVILLDVRMPGLDGFETARLIRSRRASRRTPIIFITAYGDGETDVARAYALGAVDFIFAPVIAEVLRAKVGVFIDLFIKSRHIQAQGELLRQAAEARAANLQLRLETLLNRIEVGVFRTTLDGVVIEANPAFWRLCGRAPATGVAMRDFFADPADHDRLSVRLVGGDPVQAATVRWKRGDGAQRWVSLTGTLGGSGGGEPYADGILEDVTAAKEAEAALIDKSEELARSNSELEQFAYVASHDLQEPLRMLSVYASLLSERYHGRIDDKADQFLRFMIDGATRMQNLINDLLAFSRAGSRAPSDAEVDLGALLDRCLFNLQVAVSGSGATIERGALPVVRGDEVLLGQLLQNLIANAIKFRGETPPRIRVEARRGVDGWEVAVADNGIGIAPEHHQRIFNIFQRLHPRHVFPGTGIGLAVCRKVVELHGGRIWVESVPGRGSIFRFTLATQAEPATAAAVR